MSKEPVDVRISRVALAFVTLLGAMCFGLAVVERDLVLFAGSLLFAGVVLLGLGYEVQISDSSIRGKVRVLGFQFSAWDIDLRSAHIDYLLPRWLGPLSILVVFGENEDYYVTPVLKDKKRIIKHIQQHKREAAA